jgi:hypothetical protein
VVNVFLDGVVHDEVGDHHAGRHLGCLYDCSPGMRPRGCL